MNFFVKTLSVIFLSLMLNVQAVQAQRFEWVEEIVQSQTGNLTITHITADDSGNIYIAGVYTGNILIDTVLIISTVFNQNLFFAKLSPNRQLIWVQTIRSPTQSFPGVTSLNNLIVDKQGNVFGVVTLQGPVLFGSTNASFTAWTSVFFRINSNGSASFLIPLATLNLNANAIKADLVLQNDSIVFVSHNIGNVASSAGVIKRYSKTGVLLSTWNGPTKSGSVGYLFDQISFGSNNRLHVSYIIFTGTGTLSGITRTGLSTYGIVTYNPNGTIFSNRLVFESNNSGEGQSLPFNLVSDTLDNIFLSTSYFGPLFSPVFNSALTSGSNRIITCRFSLDSGITWSNYISQIFSSSRLKIKNNRLISAYNLGDASVILGSSYVPTNRSNIVISYLFNGTFEYVKEILNGVTTSIGNISNIEVYNDQEILFCFRTGASSQFDSISLSGSGRGVIGTLSCLPRNLNQSLVIDQSTPCFNGAIQITAQSFPFTNYNWTATGGGVVTAVGNQATVSWPNPGTYTVSVNPFNACGAANGKTDTIVVRGTPPQPDSLIGDTVVCFTGTRAYSIPLVAGADNYSWSLSGGGSLIPINNTAIVNWNAPGTYTLRVTPNNDCGIGDTLNTTIVVTTPPSQPGLISGNTDVCTGNQNYTLPGLPGTDYLWSVSSGGTLNSNGNTASINWSVAGTHTITVIPSNGCATGPSRNLTVTVKQAPSQPSTIIGNSNSCLGFQSYSILETTGTNYTWSLSSGGTLSAFAGSATINWNQGGVHVLSVTPQNSCGSGPTRSLQVVVNDVPPPPGAIQGLDTVCLGAQSYAVSGQSGTNYNWTLSGGGSLTPTGSSALINWTNPGNYTLTVSPVNICGLGNQVIKQVFVRNVTAQIGGIAGANNACLVNENYTVPLIGGFTYNWSLTGGGSLSATANNAQVNWTSPGSYALTVSTNDGCARSLLVNVRDVPSQPAPILGDTVSCLLSKPYSISTVSNANYQWVLSGGGVLNFGQGNASVNWTSVGTHTLQVTPSNQCGNGPLRSIAIAVNDVPDLPSSIQGVDSTCTINRSYSVVSTAGTDYVWAVTGGGQLTSNGSAATVNWSNRGTYSLSVTPLNSCGSGATRSTTVWVESFPQQPAISGDTLTCLGTEVYRIVPVNSNQYTWQLPLGGSLIAAGDSAQVTWNTTGIFPLQVIASNFCGNAAPAMYSVRVKTIPLTPSTLTGDTITCLGNKVYAVPSQAETSWAWNLSGGGQVSPLGNSITINWTQPGNYTLSATPNNICGVGGAVLRTIRILDIPTQPAAILGNSNLCIGSLGSFTVPNIPGTSYTWNLSAGGILNSTGNSASVTMSSTGNFLLTVSPSNLCGTGPTQSTALVSATIPAQPASITGDVLTCLSSKVYSTSTPTGNALNWSLSSGGTLTPSGNSATVTWTNTGNHLLTVTASNFCGTGPAQSLAINAITIPAQPSIISGDTFSCPGTKQYQVLPLSGTSFNWSLSSGGALSVNQNNASVNWISPGNHQLAVTASNLCGTGVPRFLNVNTAVIPSQPSSINGVNALCVNVSGSFFILPNPGESYTWSAPQGLINIVRQDSVLVIWANAGAFTIGVSASNSCGSSAPRTLSLTVDPLPSVNQAISGRDSLCIDDNEVYSLQQIPTVNFNWSLSNGQNFVNLGNGVFVRWNRAGEYLLSMVPSNACGTGDSLLKPIFIYGPLEKPVITYRNDTLFSSVATGNQWIVNNIPQTLDLPYFIPDRNSTVRLKAFNPCFESATTDFVTWSLLNPSDFGIEVYPNPARQQVFVQFPLNVLWKRVSIVDIQGKVLGEYLYSGQDLLTVDIDNISKGLYFVKMETQDGTFHQKLVVQ